MKVENKLSKNQLIVYQIFQENICKKLNIKEIMALIYEKNKKISQRTVYRILDALMNIGKIYCSDMYKGMRSFELIEKNHCLLICKECKATKIINIGKQFKLDQTHIKNKNIKITGGWIKFYGLCKKCMEKNSKVIDNYNQLAYNIVENDNYNQLINRND
ncbi:transcriptional repressor [Crassaminicella profunda]|uniref:transcriptional repressor n=1 Tax=Crassaminicella profunda TaxID=1286698 RepID=UPI001CA5F50E|nr:transcriptional repressor [Crassaminicella profunda]QZY55388.1 transcriptional repressor [Crassaminicella profunda]